MPVRQIDNSAVLLAQLARLDRVKQSRDDAAVAAALQVSHFILCHVLAVHGHVLCCACCPAVYAASLPRCPLPCRLCTCKVVGFACLALSWHDWQKCGLGQMNTECSQLCGWQVWWLMAPVLWWCCWCCCSVRRWSQQPAVKPGNPTCWSWQCRYVTVTKLHLHLHVLACLACRRIPIGLSH